MSAALQRFVQIAQSKAWEAWQASHEALKYQNQVRARFVSAIRSRALNKAWQKWYLPIHILHSELGQQRAAVGQQEKEAQQAALDAVPTHITFLSCLCVSLAIAGSPKLSG